MNDLFTFVQTELAGPAATTDGAPSYSFLLPLLLLAFAAWLCGYLCKRLLVPFIVRIVAHTETKIDDYFLNKKVLDATCRVLPGGLFYLFMPLCGNGAHSGLPARLYGLIGTSAEVYIAVTALLLITAFLSNIITFTTEEGEGKNHHLVGIVQFLKIVVYGLGAIIVIAILSHRNPINLIAGLGAAVTVLMLVFRDSILGLVAGIQLSANHMLKPGDWVTIEKLGINGTVERVSLTTVKIRNFDNTISTVPPYTLVSDSFQNWEGMFSSGVRRVKRCLYIDANSIRFCDKDLLVQLQARHLLTSEEPKRGERPVNLTLFRNYVELMLKKNEQVSHTDWILVRQLDPTPNGLPLECWFYFRETEFVAYEHLASETFEQLIALLPVFGLRLFQAPSGFDLHQINISSL